MGAMRSGCRGSSVLAWPRRDDCEPFLCQTVCCLTGGRLADDAASLHHIVLLNGSLQMSLILSIPAD